MVAIPRTIIIFILLVLNCIYGQQSDTVKEPKSSENQDQSGHAKVDASNSKAGSSAFAEFKGNIPIDQSYRPYISSVNVGSFGGQILRSSSVLREAQLQSAASRAEQASGSGESQCNDDLACLTLANLDRQGIEAIRSLHRQLDDDANGAVDLSESDEFLREELQYENGAEKRQRAFHRNDDMHISVKELWEAWVRSEVHNWTVEQTTEWLSTSVELPQYVPLFIMHRVTGATLPRLAVSNMQYLSNVLGIKDPIHKQKIALKAMDVVLFGPPKDVGSYVKDIIIVALLVGVVGGVWYAYRQTKSSKRQMRRMMKDMESLHRAEQALQNLQKELESAKQEKESATTEKQDLERRLREQKVQGAELKTSYSDLEVSQLKQEIEVLRSELQRAEGELEDRCWAPPPGLQQWLQLTHEVENRAYMKKKVLADRQLQLARDACDKLRKKRSSIMGSFSTTHGKSIDDVDRSIVEARTALSEVTQELAERCHRWKQIEKLCGFNITSNSGLQHLETLLYPRQANGRHSLRSRMGNSQDDIDDDTSSYSPTAVREWLVKSEGSGVGESVGWKESESESEKLEDDEFSTTRSVTGVHFTVGNDPDECGTARLQQSARPDVRPSGRIQRWQSQDIDPLPEREVYPGPKTSSSETNLEAHTLAIAPLRVRKNVRKDASLAYSPEEDPAYSTDSNSTAAEDGEKKKKHKLPFSFGRKSRQTTPPALAPPTAPTPKT